MPENRLAQWVAAASCGLMASAVLLAATAWGAGASSPAASSVTMHERAECAQSAVTAPAPSAEGGMPITVSVPATVVLQVEWNGELIAAMTNTGCAPRGDEDIHLMWPDRSMSECVSLQTGALVWSGDFTEPGVYQPQRGDVVCG